MTNLEFSKTDKVFQENCQSVGLPTAGHTLARQASKWRRSKGLAYCYNANYPLYGSNKGKAA